MFGYQHPSQKTEPEPPSKPVIEQRLCVVCGMKTMIKLCWYLFQYNHPNCDVWACYYCNARNHQLRWWKPEASIIHTDCGYGDKVS